MNGQTEAVERPTSVTAPETESDEQSAGATDAEATATTSPGEGGVQRQRAEWPERPSRRDRLMRAVNTAAAELRVVQERPDSLHSALTLARRGAWATTQNGPLRQLAVVHFWLIQAPALVAGALLVWSARTAGRIWTVVPLVVTVATAVNALPVVGLIVPDFLTWPYWPPFCWFN